MLILASQVAQIVKCLPAMRETWVRSLGWEDSLEKGMATHSSILACRIPMDRGAWQTIQSMGSQRIRQNLTTEQQQLQNMNMEENQNISNKSA